MGYCVTTPEREKVRQKKLTCTQKTASREIFSYSIKTSQENRSQAPELHQGNRLTTTKIASGIPYWPSRDPIEERGGINLYAFVANDVVNYYDLLGMERCPLCVDCKAIWEECTDAADTLYDGTVEGIDASHAQLAASIQSTLEEGLSNCWRGLVGFICRQRLKAAAGVVSRANDGAKALAENLAAIERQSSKAVCDINLIDCMFDEIQGKCTKSYD